MRKPSQQRTIEKCLYAHLHTYTQPTQLFAAGAQLADHSQPALRTGLMAPCLASCSIYLGCYSRLDTSVGEGSSLRSCEGGNVARFARGKADRPLRSR